MLHEEADSGMPRVLIQAVQIVPTCPACTTGIRRWEARKKKMCDAKRRREKGKKKNKRQRRRKEEIALSRQWTISCDSLDLIRMRKN